jgi:hypothetical protein
MTPNQADARLLCRSALAWLTRGKARRSRVLRNMIGAVLLLGGRPAWAQDQPQARDGGWLIGGAQVMLPKIGPGANLLLIATHQGDRDADSLLLQASVPVADHLLLINGVGVGRLGRGPEGGDRPGFRLLRTGFLFSRMIAGVEVNNRTLLEGVVIDGAANDVARLRNRTFAYIPVPILPALRPRLYFSGEIFLQRGEGHAADRLAAGVRTTIASRYQLDVYLHRERNLVARETGTRDALVAQLLVIL